MPEVEPMQPFRQFIEQHTEGNRYIAHCYEEVERVPLFTELQQVSSKDALVLVGPEGDFSIEEVRMAVASGYKSVSLGTSRLRTETAGLMAIAMMRLAFTP
jgi:16S rRNA (uracil1498-N3)-methyltransferase